MVNPRFRHGAEYGKQRAKMEKVAGVVRGVEKYAAQKFLQCRVKSVGVAMAEGTGMAFGFFSGLLEPLADGAVAEF